jgi:hypothetical protein
MRKQSQSQITGREGERWFASILPPEWSIQRTFEDFGLDAIIAVGDKAHVTAYEFGVQIKSSARFNRVRDCVVVPQISREMVAYWSRKFFPTLLVAYDVKKKVGYFDWVSNLVRPHQIESGQQHLYLHIPQARVISPENWAIVNAELVQFHEEFSNALKATREILPIATEFATMLRNLCVSDTSDRSARDGQVLYTMVQAWTHIEVVRRLDQLTPKIRSGSIAARNLSAFRDFYFQECEKIFADFAKLCSESDGAGWILMKKDSEPALKILTAALAECVSGLLRHVSPIGQASFQGQQ